MRQVTVLDVAVISISLAGCAPQDLPCQGGGAAHAEQRMRATRILQGNREPFKMKPASLCKHNAAQY